MQIVFNAPFAFSPDSTSVDDARELSILLETLVKSNLAYLKDHSAPALYQSGVVYGRTLWWETIDAVRIRGYGDCKSLAAWLIAEYTKAGIACKPVFRWYTNKEGGKDFHILVQTRNGYEDPSKVLGMGTVEVAKFKPNPLTG